MKKKFDDSILYSSENFNKAYKTNRSNLFYFTSNEDRTLLNAVLLGFITGGCPFSLGMEIFDKLSQLDKKKQKEILLFNQDVVIRVFQLCSSDNIVKNAFLSEKGLGELLIKFPEFFTVYNFWDKIENIGEYNLLFIINSAKINNTLEPILQNVNIKSLIEKLGSLAFGETLSILLLDYLKINQSSNVDKTFVKNSIISIYKCLNTLRFDLQKLRQNNSNLRFIAEQIIEKKQQQIISLENNLKNFVNYNYDISIEAFGEFLKDSSGKLKNNNYKVNEWDSRIKFIEFLINRVEKYVDQDNLDSIQKSALQNILQSLKNFTALIGDFFYRIIFLKVKDQSQCKSNKHEATIEKLNVCKQRLEDIIEKINETLSIENVSLLNQIGFDAEAILLPLKESIQKVKNFENDQLVPTEPQSTFGVSVSKN